MNPILAFSGIQQGALLARRELTSRELVGLHLDRIDAVNPALNAVVEVLRETAIAGALASDARRKSGSALGPFDGVPFSVKDSMEVRGTVCSAGTQGFRKNAESSRDASVVAALRRAGAIPVARTNLPDLLFAFESDNLIVGRTNNPYDPARTSGGSSGGEAALIASGGSPFGLGSDAAGSVRLPAHYCGIASIKPTSGRLPRTGHVPPSGGWLEAIWQIGPMARRVEDLQFLMPLLGVPDGEDRTVIAMPHREPGDVPLSRLRVAYFVDNGIAAADRATSRVVTETAKVLGERVASLELKTPPLIEQSYELEMGIIGPDGGDGLRQYLQHIGSTETHPLLEGWLNKLELYRTGVAGFARYWSELDRFRNSMFRFLQDYDVILSPVSTSPAILHGQSTQDEIFRGFSYTMTHNITGWPAAVVRCGTSIEGLPIGVQVAAAPWREDLVLAVLAVLEQELGGWQATEK
jgi:amidase